MQAFAGELGEDGEPVVVAEEPGCRYRWRVGVEAAVDGEFLVASGDPIGRRRWCAQLGHDRGAVADAAATMALSVWCSRAVSAYAGAVGAVPQLSPVVLDRGVREAVWVGAARHPVMMTAVTAPAARNGPNGMCRFPPPRRYCTIAEGRPSR
ncbi:hypothetical protein GCM10020218_024230 [Dactylosporangium vinaceum]